MRGSGTGGVRRKRAGEGTNGKTLEGGKKTRRRNFKKQDVTHEISVAA